MATQDFVPLEKRAKGKSNVFKFVSLRNPESVSSDEASKQFINHPNLVNSVFVAKHDPKKRMSPSDLSKISNGFSAFDSLESLRKINPSLFDFSDWLSRNRKIIDQKVADQMKSVSSLDEKTLLNIWDNLFYFIIQNKDAYLREAILKLIVADNFVKLFEKLGTTNEDAQKLACASVIVPKAILSLPTSVNSSSNFVQREAQYNTIDEDALNTQLQSYKNAIKELQEVNTRYIKTLSEVDVDTLKKEETATPKDASDVVIARSNVSSQDIRNSVENPLSDKQLSGVVTKETIEIVVSLDLARTEDPIKAINKIEGEIASINRDLFSLKTLSRQQIKVGGSVLELQKDNDNTSDFNQGCFPTIIDQVGIFTSTISSTVDPSISSNFIRSTVTGIGNSGGASQEKMSDYGSVSFTMSKAPTGAGYYIGLSPQNTDPSTTSIKYAIRINSRIDSTTSAVNSVAQAYVNGVATGSFIRVSSGDQFKIARVDTAEGAKIVFNRYRPSTGLLSLIHTTNDTSSGSDLEALQLDFAFTRADQVVHSVYFDPCGGSSDSSGGNESECSGVKSLGISDYMRVEQEICCYTPGEVSHIENVLQGEYKERSTRRLRRQENITTTESETTNEKLRDTTTTDRYEMEQETSQVIQEDTIAEVGVTVSSKFGPTRLTVDSGFASATATTDAHAQAVSYAREVSTRALDRVVNRIREERITKIIEEFEENNVHGLDNSKNTTGHVTGIYRWVDKIYKNQVVNYGKRLSYEFMIPEPAKFHLWAKAKGDVSTDFEIPEDPREHGLSKHSDLDESNYAQWSSAYDVDVMAPPAPYIEVMEGYAEHPDSAGSHSKSFNTFQLPEGYILESIELDGNYSWNTSHAHKKFISIAVANQSFSSPSGFRNLSGYKQSSLPISLHASFVATYFFNVTAKLRRKNELLEQWKIDTFRKIMESYQQKKAEYENALSEARAQASLGIQIEGNNPLHNRTTEREELKKNCLRWLNVGYGADFYQEVSPCDGSSGLPEMQTNGTLSCYAKKVKFFEQAFDWDIMTYLFYPYFYGQKCKWKEVYKLDDNDHIFRGFLQSGMARVVVPVKPTYEKAVIYYMETGELWEGSEVPVPSDAEYEAIISNIEDQSPTPIGDAWETRVPTSLNILQKDSASVVGDGLPCNCNDYVGEGTGGSTLIGGTDTPA